MEDKNKLLVIIRIRGRPNVHHAISETLDRLRLKHVNNCILMRPDASSAGMLKKCENHVAYGEINDVCAKKLLAKYLPDINAEDILSGKSNPKEFKDQFPFRLKPPRHGFKSTKRSFTNGGSLGNMGEEVNKLLTRMI